METIRNYLETMFQNMPNTPNVIKAKNELYTMMEDKYNALCAEGMSAEEAVAKVIAECGSIADIAGDLGIENEFARTQNESRQRSVLSESLVLDYLNDNRIQSFIIALAVGLFIAAIAFVVGMASVGSSVLDTLGVCGMFVIWAVAVGMLVVNASSMSKWAYLKSSPCQLDFPTLSMVNELYSSEQKQLAVRLAAGIILCILSILPPIVVDAVSKNEDDAGAVLLLLMIAAGVGLIVSSSIRRGAFQTLLRVNDRETVGGNQFASQKNFGRYTDPSVEFLMGVYWQTVTCIYLAWSFLTFDWWITWLIWPVAGVIWAILKAVFAGGERR